MRVLHVVVPADQRDAARDRLEDEDFTPVAISLVDREGVLLQIPVPSNAVDDALSALEAADVDVHEYTVVTSAEAALTETSETLERRYVGRYEPLTAVELRTKARDLSRDTGSYAALMVLSAVIATAGLLIGSPAIVVGSMVIAPIIGPALTASVGTVTGDRAMIVDSIWMQLYGLGLAVAAAAAIAAAFRVGGFVPTTLNLPSLTLVGVRLAPNALSLLVGAASGLAAGLGLTTKGPTSIIGVMIAAALIPTAAACGLAVAWLDPALAVGTAVLLLATMVLINLTVLSVLVGLGYRKRGRATPGGDQRQSLVVASLLAIAVLALTLAVVAATVDQTATDREIQSAVDDTVADPAYANLSATTVQTQYGDLSPFTGPRNVTVTVTDDGGGAANTSAFATDLAATIENRTGEPVTVQVETTEYTVANVSANGTVNAPANATNTTNATNATNTTNATATVTGLAATTATRNTAMATIEP